MRKIVVEHHIVWLAGIKGLFTHGLELPGVGESVTGLPADFLIDNQGKVLVLKYGSHAYDHWERDEVIELADTNIYNKGTATAPLLHTNTASNAAPQELN